MPEETKPITTVRQDIILTGGRKWIHRILTLLQLGILMVGVVVLIQDWQSYATEEGGLGSIGVVASDIPPPVLFVLVLAGIKWRIELSAAHEGSLRPRS